MQSETISPKYQKYIGPDDYTYFEPIGGLTKKEWFAGMALQGLFSGMPFSDEEMTENDKIHMKRIASFCEAMGDAMIEQLQGGHRAES